MLYLSAFVLGVIVGALVVRNWENISDFGMGLRDRVQDLDPDEVQQRRVGVTNTLRRNALLVFVGLVVLAVVFAIILAPAPQKTVGVGSSISLTDKCGEAHNVQIEQAHVDQGFVLVAPTTQCELKYPLAAVPLVK